MYSKEEKLAAARKKLREFQGKQRVSVINKKNVPHDVNTSYKDLTSQTPSQSPSSYTSESSHTSSYHEHMPEKDEPYIEKKLTYKSDSVNAEDPSKTILLMHNQNVSENSATIVISPEKSDAGDFISHGVNENLYRKLPNKDNEIPRNQANGLYSGERVTHAETHSFTTLKTSDSDKINHGTSNLFRDTEFTFKEMQHNNNNSNSSLVQDSITNPERDEPKDFFWTTFTSGKKPKETEPLNKEIPDVSVSQLVEENTNLSEVLKRTQELLKYKTGEEENLSQKVSFLQLKVKDLEGSISNAESEIQKLQLRNEELMKRKEIDNNMLEEIKQKYESKMEQYSELQQKLELKNKECEYLNIKLQETQSQLSSSLLKIQQLNIGESPAINLRVSELQIENASLTNRIQDLEKTLDSVNKEKEESSQSFQTYAQQCNAQLKSLSSEVRTLANENRSLMQEIKVLEKNLNDLENEKKELKDAADHTDLKSLTDEITQLKDENKMLELRLKEKVKDIEVLKTENKQKLNEINELFSIVKEIRSENIKLMEDRERTNRNEKLLAAMESDKVAAARAVSQNQKLKDQVFELEEGFIKLSHEKLQLTDELAHEKHLKKEVELRLQELQSSHCSDHDHHHSSVTVTNESSDVNELKKIIRQLEEDKTELISRLKSSNYSEAIDKSKDIKTEKDNPEWKPCTNEDPENLKMVLQQMEEKLKKTMNEIAVLDEEKEKLEHINLQLQCETETIGEYISLYQNQRMLLRKRSKEKDDQLMQLSKDKEELKSKLVTLNHLVNHLLAEKGKECKETTDVSKTADDQNTTEYSEATAEKIQNLISEIQSTNLINSQSVGFEHCPCCSGRLITV